MPDNDSSLQGCTILIVQPNWVIANALASVFEATGAQVVLAKNSHPDLANVTNLAGAVLGNHGRDLCQQLQARGIPFVLYTSRVDHECGATAIIQMPAPPREVVARVEELLT